MPSNLSANKPACGAEWEGTLYYYPDASSPIGPMYTCKEEELDELLKNVDKDAQKKISKIYVLDTPLTRDQKYKYIYKHSFIVLQTKEKVTEGNKTSIKDEFWSIEKNSSSIVLQRADSPKAVVERFGLRERIDTSYIRGIDLDVADYGKGSMKELIEWLKSKECLKEKYDVALSSCRNFAQQVFNRFAKTKTCLLEEQKIALGGGFGGAVILAAILVVKALVR